MSRSTIQSTTMGKAYEYACVLATSDLLRDVRPFEIIENSSLETARLRYSEMLASATAGMRVIIEMGQG